MDGIEKITGRITADMDREIASIQAEARRQADEITASAAAQAKRESEEILARGRSPGKCNMAAFFRSVSFFQS